MGSNSIPVREEWDIMYAEMESYGVCCRAIGQATEARTHDKWEDSVGKEAD